ncbi:MAG TPA: glycosyl hydrolase family 79 C-terminal domain-containing protein [Solirubrobacteraceae bacterium]|nr:glycosyl hydrolase family 79 C-terminal domain-containing protein [Solirubrobacteraceae bacterium]
MPPDRRISSGRAHRRWFYFAVAIALTITACGGNARAPSRNPAHTGNPRATGGGRVASGHPRPAGRVDPVTVRAAVPGTVRTALPKSFLGLSMEYWDLPAFHSRPAVLDRVLSLLHVPGDGPLLLRVGGDSADQAYWGRHPSLRLGPWPYHLTGGWLHTLAEVVRSAHVRAMLDLNLAARSPAMAAHFARAALRTLPRGSLTGFEIGNEPDIYHHWVNYHMTGRAGLLTSSGEWDQFSPARYVEGFAAYARALARVAPNLPLAGPATARPLRDIAWERRLLTTERSRVGMVTIHRYPLTACAHRNARNFSTVARVLSTRIAAGLGLVVAPALALARQAGLPARLTELNSVTCGGRRGVSNTFASALWAPDALFSLWKAGLAGANIHVRQGAANAAFWMSRRGLRARPLLYGLALFARALGHRGQLAHLRVARSSPSVRLWAVRNGRRLNLLVLDKGPHPAHLVLRIGSRGPALIQRLSAPSVEATTGVRLAGQTLAASGRWVGRRTTSRVARGSGRRYRLRVAAYSAALISFRL